MILNVSHLSKTFVGEPVIRDASFFLNEHDRAAIVGPNGAGKTTLLNLITGELPADSGQSALKKDARMGYLHQINEIHSNLTIREELTKVIQPLLDMEERLRAIQEEMKSATGDALENLYREYDRTEHAFESRDGYSARSRVNGILNGLGFPGEDADKRMQELSGGQKTRVFLGKLLLEQPDLILLDEPTNHLDLSSIEWLETFLINYPGAVLVVSHDRYFLDRIVTKVLDLDMGTVTSYTGNYTQYAEKKAQIREAKRRAYLNQQQEIRRQEEVITKLRSFNREKSIRRAESREKMLEKVDRLEKPEEIKTDMELRFSMEEASGNDVLTVSDISKSFDGRALFSHVSFELKRGEHVCIIGANGTGKTTILKILNGLLMPDTGSVTLGARVLCAYYDQEHQVLHPELTLFEELQNTWPDMNNTEVRNMLAAFLFTGDDVYKRVADLSGGERGRLSLAKLMLSHANFLILDEPTNHLDMPSKEILEEAIRAFPGTVLCVSHDRYFINRTSTRILDLTHGRLLNYIGNYDYYLEKRREVERAAGISASDAAPGTSAAAGGGSTGGSSGAAAGRKDTFSASAGSGTDTASSGRRLSGFSASDSRPSGAAASAPAGITSSHAEWERSKIEKAKEKKRKAALEKCEKRIHDLAEDLKEIEAAFASPENQRDAAALIDLQKRKDADDSELSSLYDEWETLASEEDL